MEGADRSFEALEVTLVSHRNRNVMSAYAFSESGYRIVEFGDGRGESRASSYGVLAAIKLVSPDDEYTLESCDTYRYGAITSPPLKAAASARLCNCFR